MTMPTFLARFVLWFLTRTFYRLTIRRAENVPSTGGALLVVNHTSWIDPGVILASIKRPVRFLAYRDYCNAFWLRPLAKAFRAIPISTEDSPSEIVKALKEAREAIRNGELVCIFAEGEITRTGQLLNFRKGLELVVKGTNAPIIPIHLDRLWGSVFSYSEQRFFWKFPNAFPYPITVTFGTPMPCDTPAYRVRTAIQELGTEAYIERDFQPNMLHRSFIRRARRSPFQFCMADLRTPPLNFIKTLAGSIALARKLKGLLDDQSIVGVLVPPSVGGCLVNIALHLMGRTPVNLNYTASAQALQLAAKQCGMTQIITAHAFLERMPMEVPGIPLYLEDIKKAITTKDQVIGLLLALFCPVRVLDRMLGGMRERSPEDLSTIIFSSGSEGDPKGIMLTHRNILSNLTSVLEVVPHSKSDRIIGMLPFFHSFGYLGGIWIPLVGGFGVIYHVSPLEAKTVGGLIQKYKGSILIATSTFLQNFIRKCASEELQSLRLVVCGAEKLAQRVREGFNEKFGVEALEAFGTTECSPAVSINVPDFVRGGFHQVGNKPGTVGRPIPGVSVRIVDPDTQMVIDSTEPGLLEVKGPNIMKGYLGMPEKTASVLKDGWYSTGDIATVDEDGFIKITDRLARFSKIASEMVSHTKVEETLYALLGDTDQHLAVTGLPDMQRGERLVVLHTLSDEQLKELIEKMDKMDQHELPNLWRPRPNAFFRIEAIPVLGTGKMDIRGVKALAKQLDPEH